MAIYILNGDKTPLSPAGLLSSILTVDGAGSGLDADTLDGLQASDFALAGSGGSAETSQTILDKLLLVDGTGSGLDADTLDGLHASDFALAGSGGTVETAAQILAKIVTVDGTGSGLDADTLDGLHATDFALAGSGGSAETSQTILDKLLLVDGTGSGLDADMLDGLDSAAFQPALGFTPIQQGTGINQTPNPVKMGWSLEERLKVTVDAVDVGNVVFDSQLTQALSTKADATSVIPASLLAAIATVDGSLSGLDADTVDGVHADVLFRTTGGNIDGKTHINAPGGSVWSDRQLTIMDNAGSNPAIGFAGSVNNAASIKLNADSTFSFVNWDDTGLVTVVATDFVAGSGDALTAKANRSEVVPITGGEFSGKLSVASPVGGQWNQRNLVLWDSLGNTPSIGFSSQAGGPGGALQLNLDGTFSFVNGDNTAHVELKASDFKAGGVSLTQLKNSSDISQPAQTISVISSADGSSTTNYANITVPCDGILIAIGALSIGAQSSTPFDVALHLNGIAASSSDNLRGPGVWFVPQMVAAGSYQADLYVGPGSTSAYTSRIQVIFLPKFIY